MSVIHKERFTKIGEDFEITAGIFDTVVHVEMQSGSPTMWILKKDADTEMQRTFHVFATGREISEEYAYVSTFQDPPYVWHLFEKVMGYGSCYIVAGARHPLSGVSARRL